MRHDRLIVVVVALALATAGCAVLTIDVDVYKGALANHESVQTEQLAAMAMGAKPLIAELRALLERKECFAYLQLLEDRKGTLSRLAPSDTTRLRQASAAAPAPEATIFTSLMFLAVRCSAFLIAAPTMMAVPCWSSWNTGIFMRALSLSSMSKHSGALKSSRLIPPNVGSSADTTDTT